MFYITSTPWCLRVLFPAKLTWRIPTNEKIIYLTFDDGPDAVATPFVLNELKKYNAKATFFCIGSNVQREPHLFKRISDEGHRIGNHTHDHLNGFYTKNELWLNNVNEAAKWIDSNLFRPPYGKITPFQAKTLRSQNPAYKIIMWSVISADFDIKNSPQKCFKFVKNCAKAGSIVVFHDSEKAFPNMKYALSETLKHYSQLGYRFEAIP